MNEIQDTNSTYASLVIRGKNLNPEEITRSLGINPSRKFKRGDVRVEDKLWPHGYWEYSSDKQVISDDLSDHLIWLINHLEPIKNNLLETLNAISADALITCLLILPKGNSELTISPELLGRIADLRLMLSLDFYCL